MTMKLTKSEFKEMLKECIVELVKEGKLPLTQLFTTENVDSHQQQGSQTFRQHNMPSPEGNNMYGSQNNRLNEAVKATAMAVAKGDPKQSKMFESVFMDTALTTLQEKLHSDKALSSGGAGGFAGLPATPEQREIDQAQLNSFAGKNTWAKLAFGGASSNNGNGGKMPGGNQ